MNDTTLYLIIFIIISIFVGYFFYPVVKKFIFKENLTTGTSIKTGHPLTTVISNVQDSVAESALSSMKNAVNINMKDATDFTDDMIDISMKLEKKLSTAQDGRSKNEDYLLKNGPKMYTEQAVKSGSKLLSKYGLHASLKRNLLDKIQFDVNKLATDGFSFVKNFDDDKHVFKINDHTGDTMDQLFDLHLKRQSPKDKAVRYVKPITTLTKNKSLNVIKGQTNDIIHSINSDHPLLSNNGALLPNAININDKKPLNLEVANLLAQNRRYYVKPQTVVRSSTDPRGIPKALIETVMKNNSSKDPNSLQMSVNYNPIDILESGRGFSNSHETDMALAHVFDNAEIPIIDNFAKVMDNITERNPGNLRKNIFSNKSIMQDVKYGTNDEHFGLR